MSDTTEGIGPPDHPTTGTEQPEARSRPGYGRLPLLIGVGVVVATALTVFTMSILGSASSTGAASPEEAFEALVRSIEDEDALGIANLLDPQELGFVVDGLEDLDTDLVGLPGGLDLTASGLDGGDVTATFAQLGGPDSGLVAATINGFELALVRTDDAPLAITFYDDLVATSLSTAEADSGSEIRVSFASRAAGFDMATTGRINGESLDRVEQQIPDVPLEIVFLETDGRWYLSLGYTIANLVVSAGVVDEPDYGAWRKVLEDETSGAESPSAVVRRFMDAAPSLDIDRGVAALDPIELRLLHDFLPVISAEIDDDLAQAREEATLEISELRLSEEIAGDRARVHVEFVSIRSTDAFGDETVVELDDQWCYLADEPTRTVSGCLEDDVADAQRELDAQLQGTGIDLDLLDLIPDSPFVVTTERNGRWYLSPVATIVAYGEQVASAATEAFGQLEDQLRIDSGVLPAINLPTGQTTNLTVVADSVTAMALTPPSDQYTDLFGADLALVAVTLTSDVDIDVQHNVDSPDNLNRARLRAGTPLTLLSSSENVFPRTQTLLLRNRGDQSAEVTIDVAAMELDVVDAGRTLSGSIDAAGSPWLVSVADDVTISGAELSNVMFDRFPWLEPGRFGEIARDSAFVMVKGEPGAHFTIESS